MPTNAAGGRSSAATKTKAARRNTSRSATASTTSSRSRRRTTIKGLKPSKSVTRKSADTPPAVSVAAAQKVLWTVDRRENSLRTALKRHGKTLEALKESAANHRDTVTSLKADLKK